jgi:hypothetical protein
VFWVVLGGIGLVVLIVGSFVQGFVQLVFAPHREPVSEREFLLLATLSVVAFVAAVTVAATLGGWWLVVPIAMWLVAVSVVRNLAPERETKQQRIAREAAEKKRAASEAKRAAARKAVAERKRVDVFGKDGVGLMDRAELAVNRVMATEAVKEGWLGEPGDLDFSVDLALIGETLSRARRIERVAAESKSIPKPNADEIKLLREAERSVKQLRAEATRRVQMLNGCARQARQVDQTLAEEREQARLEALRDDLSRRLAAELYGAEAAASVRMSEAADHVTAHVAAFRELKGVIDEQRRVEITDAPVAADVEPSTADEDFFGWLRRQQSF